MLSIVKKTLKVAKETGNDVIVQVKKNQKTLLKDCQNIAETKTPGVPNMVGMSFDPISQVLLKRRFLPINGNYHVQLEFHLQKQYSRT